MNADVFTPNLIIVSLLVGTLFGLAAMLLRWSSNNSGLREDRENRKEEQMIKCPNCGSSALAGAKCPNCGSQVPKK